MLKRDRQVNIKFLVQKWVASIFLKSFKTFLYTDINRTY